MARVFKIAVIGAGITGLHLARQLSDVAEVTVFDKSRGLGGRMSTRRRDGHQFDHGAQYFTAHGARFGDFLTPHIESGTVVPWAPKLVEICDGKARNLTWNAPRYVAVPGMTGLAKAMSEGIDIVGNTRITALFRQDGKWHVDAEDKARFGPFDWVISTAPEPQTKVLLPDSFGPRAALDAVKMRGCYSLMIGFDARPDVPWDAAVVQDSPLAWIAFNGSKPGRTAPGCVVCQSANDWAEAHLEDDQAAVKTRLCHAFQDATHVDVARAGYVSLHRWRYAKVVRPAAEDYLIDVPHQLAAAGDWCGAGRVEAGFESAAALAARLRAQFGA